MSSKSKSNNNGFYAFFVVLILVAVIASVYYLKTVSGPSPCENNPIVIPGFLITIELS